MREQRSLAASRASLERAGGSSFHYLNTPGSSKVSLVCVCVCRGGEATMAETITVYK